MEDVKDALERRPVGKASASHPPLGARQQGLDELPERVGDDPGLGNRRPEVESGGGASVRDRAHLRKSGTTGTAFARSTVPGNWIVRGIVWLMTLITFQVSVRSRTPT